MLKAARPCLQQHEEQSLLNRVPRQLAGLLFEFVFPGQRHASFPPRADSLPLPHRKRYDNTRTIVRKFKLEYEGSNFAEYLARGQFTSSLEPNLFSTDTITLQDLPAMRQDWHFERILSEIRKCTGILEWLRPNNHKFTDYTLASPAVATAAREWILADDDRRRRALLETALAWEDPLTRFVVAAHGGSEHYERAIARCLRDLILLCRKPFQMPELEYNRYYRMHANFNLTRSTAKYYTRLLDLDLNHKKHENEARSFHAWQEVDVEVNRSDRHDYSQPPKRWKGMQHYMLY